jgi:hypothetical protein
MAWEYGPIALGAFSVWITLFPIFITSSSFDLSKHYSWNNGMLDEILSG